MTTLVFFFMQLASHRLGFVHYTDERPARCGIPPHTSASRHGPRSAGASTQRAGPIAQRTTFRLGPGRDDLRAVATLRAEPVEARVARLDRRARPLGTPALVVDARRDERGVPNLLATALSISAT